MGSRDASSQHEGSRCRGVQASLPLNDRKRPSNRAALALQKCMTDKSRSVRAAAQAACEVLQDLQVRCPLSCYADCPWVHPLHSCSLPMRPPLRLLSASGSAAH